MKQPNSNVQELVWADNSRRYTSLIQRETYRYSYDTHECDLCGEFVVYERAIPNGQGEPCHRHCWADAYGTPDWFKDYS